MKKAIGELNRRAGLIRNSRAGNSTNGVTDRDQKVGGGLPVRGFVAEIDEVLASLICRAKIRHLATVYNTNFVEELIKGFASLVNGNYGSEMRHVCGNTESTAKFEGCRSVQTTSGTTKMQCQ